MTEPIWQDIWKNLIMDSLGEECVKMFLLEPESGYVFKLSPSSPYTINKLYGLGFSFIETNSGFLKISPGHEHFILVYNYWRENHELVYGNWDDKWLCEQTLIAQMLSNGHDSKPDNLVKWPACLLKAYLYASTMQVKMHKASLFDKRLRNLCNISRVARAQVLASPYKKQLEGYVNALAYPVSYYLYKVYGVEFAQLKGV